MVTPLRRLCVFCGARPGLRPAYIDAARALGIQLAHAGIGLVYGGGALGLMGALAQATLDAGGDVVGVIPRALIGRELAHPRLQKLHIVESMHARKALMADYADAFLALPGGFGTLDELFEIITWASLGIHSKPIGLLNTDGYFSPLLQLFGHLVEHNFASRDLLNTLVVRATPAAALQALLDQFADAAPAFSGQAEQSAAR